MRVFVTGATGFVGSAVVTELISAGHQVLGLSRSEEKDKLLKEAGAEIHRGDLEDPESLISGAQMCDGVIHTAFNHDFSKFKENAETDGAVIRVLGSALAGTNKPLIVTSAIGVLTPKERTLTEDDMPVSKVNPRVASEEAANDVASKGVRIAVVRLPPSVHGKGDHGFVPMLIDIAGKKSLSVYKNEGNHKWPSVHRLDAAHLFRLALENDFVPGTRFHAIAEEGVEFRKIATAIGNGLNVPVESRLPEDAAEHFGWFAHFASLDCKASSEKSAKQLGWTPQQPGLIEDLETNYFGS